MPETVFRVDHIECKDGTDGPVRHDDSADDIRPTGDGPTLVDRGQCATAS